MRTTKLGAVLASLAITTGATAVLAAGPAEADTPTQVVLTMSGQTSVTAPYGTIVGELLGKVTTDGETPVLTGSVDLERKLPGSTWKVVRTDDNLLDGLDFGSYGSHARRNAKYRAHYLGGTDGVTTWAPAYSGVVEVVTLWNIHDTSACANGHCHISGRLAPRTRHHKILVQVKHGGWQKYAVLHTNRKSKYRVGVTGSRKGTRYRIIVTRTKRITATEKRYIVTIIPARNARAATLSPR